MKSPEKTLQDIRYILDFTYLIQKTRGYYILSSFYDCNSEKTANNDRLQRSISQIKKLKIDIIDINSYVDTLKTIEEKINSNNDISFSIFSDYTNLLINPLINTVVEIIKQEENDSISKEYISLIYLIEEISIKRGTFVLFTDKNEDTSNNYLDNIINHYYEFSNIIIKSENNNEIKSEDFSQNKTLSFIDYFNILSRIINKFIELEKSILEILFLYSGNNKELEKFIQYGKNNDLLSHLSKRESHYLLEKGKLLKFSKHDNIPYLKNNMYFCISGKIKILKLNTKGNESVIELCKAGDIFFSKFFTSDSSIVSISNNTNFFVINEETFKNIFYRDTNLLTNFLKYQENYIIKKNNYLESLNSKDAKERLALFVIENKINKFENDEETFDKASIAKYLNMRPETFSRILKEINMNQAKNKKYLCSYCPLEYEEDCSKSCYVNHNFNKKENQSKDTT